MEEKKLYVISVNVDEEKRDRVVADGKVFYIRQRHEFLPMMAFATLKDAKKTAIKSYGKDLWWCDTLEVKEDNVWGKYEKWIKPYKKPWRVVRNFPKPVKG